MQYPKTKNRGSAPLPLVGPPIATQEVATTPQAIGFDWIIVARRPAGSGTWEPTMPRDDWKIVKDMMDDGTASTTQRRDQSGTVLLARLRGPE